MLNIRHLLVLVSMWSGAVFANPAEKLIGTWESPDGMARQEFSVDFGGDFLRTKMWFKDGEQWALVGSGTVYRRPGQNVWVSVVRTRAMGGIELFESTLVPAAEGEYDVSNKAYDAQGTTTETEEKWQFTGDDRYSYAIYRTVDGTRELWMEGEWVRVQE